MKWLIILIDIAIMAIGIELVKKGYDPNITITIVSIVSYTSGFFIGDLND